MSLRFEEGGGCSVKSEKQRGKLKLHNGSIMGLVSDRAGAGRHPLLPPAIVTGFTEQRGDDAGVQTGFREIPRA